MDQIISALSSNTRCVRYTGIHVFYRIAWHSDQYRTCPVAIPNVSGIYGFSGTALNLHLSISNFKPNYRYLLEMTIYTGNLHKSWSNTNIK